VIFDRIENPHRYGWDSELDFMFVTIGGRVSPAMSIAFQRKEMSHSGLGQGSIVLGWC
jgi:hypothetical protein